VARKKSGKLAAETFNASSERIWEFVLA